MAWRDSRRSRARLLLFTASIILGVAALVAINGFDDNLRRDLKAQGRSLLGADLALESRLPFDSTALALFDSLGGEQASERSFASMVYFPRTEDSRLVQVRALEGNFPFYGNILTEPAGAARQFQQGRQALVDHTLMLQFGAEVGDSVKVGALTFEIVGRLQRAPGQSGIAATVAAPVYIPLVWLPETGLEQKGSRIIYTQYFKLAEAEGIDAWVEAERDRLRAARLRTETVEERQRDLGRAFDDLTEFLNLVGFVALLLGCVGVASAVQVFVREKIAGIAVLRCLGASGRQAMSIYLLQILAMGLSGSIAGALLGTGIQTLLPLVLREFLPFETQFLFSLPAFLEGILVGTFVALLFALLPLLEVRKVSPLYVLRASFEAAGGARDPWRWGVMGLIGLFIVGFAYRQMGGLRDALIFSAGLGAAFLLLAGTARGVMWAARRFFPERAGYLWRQALANLFRPNNQTLTLMVAIGLGTLLITTLYLVQGLLLNRVSFAGGENMPNMVLFDIQSQERAEVRDVIESHGLPVLQEVPVVTMQLGSLKGRSRADWLADSARSVSRWALNREYRVTFRDTLIDTETLVEGTWQGAVAPGQPIPVSLDAEFARENLQVQLGDEIVWDVQGVPLRTVVGSLREVDYAARVQTNFLVLFPRGVLEQAPQFHVLVTRVEEPSRSAAVQRELAQRFPSVSVVDLDLILRTAEDLLSKVSFVIRFMAFFSILTGLLVLAGSVLVSRYQRLRESVLLRTLGASRGQILRINSYEYLLLGSLGALAGIMLALFAAWGIAWFSFEMTFAPRWLPLLLIFPAIAGLTVLIGLANSRGILRQPPLEVLRKEG